MGILARLRPGQNERNSLRPMRRSVCCVACVRHVVEEEEKVTQWKPVLATLSEGNPHSFNTRMQNIRHEAAVSSCCSGSIPWKTHPYLQLPPDRWQWIPV